MHFVCILYVVYMHFLKVYTFLIKMYTLLVKVYTLLKTTYKLHIKYIQSAYKLHRCFQKKYRKHICVVMFSSTDHIVQYLLVHVFNFHLLEI